MSKLKSQTSHIRKTKVGLIFMALLGSSSAGIAKAAAIPFTGTSAFSNVPPAVPDIARCGTAPPNLLVTTPPGTGTSNVGSFTPTTSNCVNVVTGNLSNGLFTFNFSDSNSLFGTYVGTIALPPTAGVSVSLLNYTVTGGTGLYAGATGTLAGSGPITFNPDSTTSSRNDITGTINPAPEPTTVALLGIGLAGIAVAARKRRKSCQ